MVGGDTYDLYRDERKTKMTMTKAQLEAACRTREQVAEGVAMELHGRYERARTWVEHDQTGPMGGVSSTVTAAVEDVDGAVRCLIVSVYSDERARDRVEAYLAIDDANATLRGRLDWADPAR